MIDALIAARLIHFASVMTLFGGASFALYAGTGGVSAIVRFLRVVFIATAALSLLSEAAWLATAIANMTGDWRDITDPEVLRSALLETEFGQVWLARMVVTVLLLLLAFFRFSAGSRTGAGLFALLSGALLASLALTGHAAAHKGPLGDVHRAVQAVHLLAGGAWLGGLLPLARVLASAKRTGSAAAIAWAGIVVRRFSWVGYWAVGLVLLTGSVNSIFLVGSLEAFPATRYGQVLAAKIALVLIMVLLASVNRFWIAPRFVTASGVEPAGALWRGVMAELALGLGVLALVSLLGTLIPAMYHRVREAEMDIVDSQVHLGPGGAAEMVAAMDALGIRSVLIDEWWMGTHGDPGYPVAAGAIRTTSPTAELASWTYPGRFSYIVRVDRRDPELRSVVRLARDSTYARALRIVPGMTRAEIADFAAGEFEGIFAAASEYGLPMFVYIAGHTDLLARYLEKFPGVKLIICHCGMPPGRAMRRGIAALEGLPDSAQYWAKIGEEPLTEAFDKVLRTADWPNVALKWAHTGSMFDAQGYPNDASRPFLRKALDTFGAERVMWASDVSANQTGETWAELLFAIRNNPDLSAAERECILGRTARNWLGWDAS